nr:MAG TPA: hypothetical protein [Caudoviricetes sp.]
MKKTLLILLTAALVFFTAGFSAVSARAESGEGEKAAQTETESVSTSESASDSVTDGSETITITKDELKQLIDDALTENQKNIIKLISEKLSAWTGLDFTAIYLIIAGAAVVLLAIIVFIVKYVRTKTRLKATQSAYALEKKIAESNSEILKTLSNDGIFKLVLEAMKEGGDDLVVKLAQALKLDEQTISKLLTAMELAEEREQKIMLALKAIAKDAGKTEIVNALSEAPTKTAVETLTLENEKLKIALGDEKVREILAK